LRKKMGSNGSEISRKEFGLNNTVKMYKYYYDNLLN